MVNIPILFLQISSIKLSKKVNTSPKVTEIIKNVYNLNSDLSSNFKTPLQHVADNSVAKRSN